MTPPFLSVENDGPDLVATNYFDTPEAAAGKLYVSCNGGASASSSRTRGIRPARNGDRGQLCRLPRTLARAEPRRRL